jgi:hypothetical protein
MANRRLAILFFLSHCFSSMSYWDIRQNGSVSISITGAAVYTMCGQPQPTRGQREPDINEKQSLLNCVV